jgi:chaperonin GroES
VPSSESDGLPIRMLHDRILVSLDREAGDRRSTGGIVIPATAAMGRRLAWARVSAIGQHVRQVQPGDRVLFDPEDKAEVEVRGEEFVLLRERDLHAVAAERIEGGGTGLYLWSAFGEGWTWPATCPSTPASRAPACDAGCAGWATPGWSSCRSAWPARRRG